MARLDADGQPNPKYNRLRREDRDVCEVLGLLHGLLADDQVVDKEVVFLAKWLTANGEFATQWPFDRLVLRLGAILQDERIEEVERADLHGVMMEIIGHPSPDYFVNAPTAFPLTKPEPKIAFHQKRFVLTGKFVYGPRKLCQAEIAARGGECDDNVTLQTDYLVIGSLSSRDWISTAWGRKIEKAVQYTQRCPICIVTEQRWADFLLSQRSATAR